MERWRGLLPWGQPVSRLRCLLIDCLVAFPSFLLMLGSVMKTQEESLVEGSLGTMRNKSQVGNTNSNVFKLVELCGKYMSMSGVPTCPMRRAVWGAFMGDTATSSLRCTLNTVKKIHVQL